MAKFRLIETTPYSFTMPKISVLMSLFCSRREQNKDINTEIFGIVKLYGISR